MNKLLGLLVVFAAIIVVASATYCKRPPYPKYGYHNGRHRYYPVGHKLTYWCKYGYSLYGYRYNYCVRRGHYYYWRYRTPVCKYDDDDDDHSDSSDSSDSSDHSDSDDSSDSSKSDTTHRRRCPNLKHPKYGKVYVQCYYYNCWATYSCNYGYTLKGSKKIKCKYNGYWSDYPPKCVYGY